MTTEITNDADIIDSRDIIARIEELEGADERDEAEDAELAALKALQDEASGYAEDWLYGAALIRGTYFTDYVMELLSDIGALPRDIPHYIVIDEEATADNIRQDYTSVDFDGVEYWVR